jgi:hypothetical protein
MTLGDVAGVLTGDTPLVLVLAVALVVLAAWIGRRASASVQRQGARLGAVEQQLHSEVTRRRQVEQLLRDLGDPLPYWPDDPAGLHRPPAGRRRDAEDLADDADGLTRETARPPVPPFPEDESARLARHRR